MIVEFYVNFIQRYMKRAGGGTFVVSFLYNLHIFETLPTLTCIYIWDYAITTRVIEKMWCILRHFLIFSYPEMLPP